jgi:hypothetical protein
VNYLKKTVLSAAIPLSSYVMVDALMLVLPAIVEITTYGVIVFKLVRTLTLVHVTRT